MKKSKRSKNTKNQKSFLTLSYEITYEPISKPFYEKLPRHVKTEIEDLFHLAHSDPGKAIPVIKAKIKEYPDAPFLYNYLMKAYSLLKDFENAERVVLENYKKHPHYLFALINYAQICLEKGELDKIPEIFDRKYDLKMIYPDRDKFYITEFVAFNGVVGEYFARTGDRKTAMLFLNTLKLIDPGHPLTKRLRKIVKPNIWDRFQNNMAKKLEEKKRKLDLKLKDLSNRAH